MSQNHPMLKTWQFMCLMVAAVLACALVTVNMVLFVQNRATQQSIPGLDLLPDRPALFRELGA